MVIFVDNGEHGVVVDGMNYVFSTFFLIYYQTI